MRNSLFVMLPSGSKGTCYYRYHCGLASLTSLLLAFVTDSSPGHCVYSLLFTQGNHITVASNSSIFTYLCPRLPLFFVVFFESHSKAKTMISRELLQSLRNLVSSRAHSSQPHGTSTMPTPQPRLPPSVLREGAGCNRNLTGHYKTF